MKTVDYDRLVERIKSGEIFPELFAMYHCARYVDSQKLPNGDKLNSKFIPLTKSNHEAERRREEALYRPAT